MAKLTSNQKTKAREMYWHVNYDHAFQVIKAAEKYQRSIKANKSKWTKFIGHYWALKTNSWNTTNDCYFSVSLEKIPKRFYVRDFNRKYVRECARLWAKGKVKEAEQYYDFLSKNVKYDYADLLTKSLAGILTKNETNMLKRWQRWKNALNGV